jgi:hypothetical protein
MKSEFRNPNSERIPKSKIRGIAPFHPALTVADAFAGLLGDPGAA